MSSHSNSPHAIIVKYFLFILQWFGNWDNSDRNVCLLILSCVHKSTAKKNFTENRSCKLNTSDHKLFSISFQHLRMPFCKNTQYHHPSKKYAGCTSEMLDLENTKKNKMWSMISKLAKRHTYAYINDVSFKCDNGSLLWLKQSGKNPQRLDLNQNFIGPTQVKSRGALAGVA